MVITESRITWLPTFRLHRVHLWGTGKKSNESGVFMRSIYQLCFLFLFALNVQLMAQSDSMKNQSVQRGKAKFQQSCSMCHGAEAMGGMGPNLVQSSLTRHDENGNL